MWHLREKFQDPGKDYRGAPFWSWNDRLSPEEVARQVKDMKEHGMGGFFMHSREGLETRYLGPEWMECVRAAVKAAKEVGMNAWLYDEDRWPSGFAGGLVASQIGDEGRAKGLVMEVIREGEVQPSGGELAIFKVRLEGERLTRASRIDGDSAFRLGPGEAALIFRREISAPSAWYNGDCYGDNLNPRSVKAFIETTFDAYLNEEGVGEEFARTIPGIFTDEPNIAGFHKALRPGSRALPWTDIFPQYFKEKRGYDFFEIAPYIFFDGPESVRARHDYWRTVSELFVEAYSKQLGEWCERHGIALTGHYLAENDFAGAIRVSGAIMPHYEYEQQPGIDILMESTSEILTVKQCSSAANQFGRKRVLSELYGCSGWEFTFEGQKWVGDWQYALGVNLRCQHLALYSLRGCRKRDYPPSFNYNTTWWKYNKVVEDYFARIGLVTSSGDAVRDILVVHPIASAWCVFDGHNGAKANEMGRDFQELAKTLLALHRDFDFGDEALMEKYGKANGQELAVNQASYKVVILPPMLTIRESTVKLLAEFMDAGGKVIAIKPLPALVDARPDNILDRLTRHPGLIALDSREELASTLDKLLCRRISIQTTPGQEAESFLYMERKCDGKSAFFVVNNARDTGYRVKVKLAGSGRVEEWDPLTGKIKGIPAEERDGYVSFWAEFGPADSKIYVVDPEGEPEVPKARPWRVKRISYLGPTSAFKRTDPNVLTLDVCQYRFEGEDWSEPMPIWQAQKAVREKLGMRSVHTNGIEQRWRWVDEPHPKDGTPVEFRITFGVRDVPEGPVFLVLEGASDFSIFLNGESIPGEPVGWYLDRAFSKLALPKLLPGENELVLKCAYKNRMEVEDCFIIGDFGVDVMTREITREPSSLRFGDWCLQGYPHYAGSIIYESDVEFDLAPEDRVVMYLGPYSAIHVAVWVNGKLAGHIPWRSANGLDITEALVRGKNTIGIEVVASPRNMLGPLHQKSGRKPWTDANSFRTQGEEYTPEYMLHPFGLMGQVRLEVRG